ncbi:hypothetical protein LPC08_06465 [Roseomonas sp. OT10]|nr:hypothetical protein [Roseomonas sp. OT10]UFN50265.1 hypothetical protein LPC08_06465 [Roseomonas sp. OT10]
MPAPAAMHLRGRPGGRMVRQACGRLDEPLFRVPAIRRNAWYALILLHK